MTDLVKTYKTIGAAKSVAKKRDIDASCIVTKGGLSAVVEKPKYRAYLIKTPTEQTRREFVWAYANELLAAGDDYKTLRRKIFDEAYARGYRYVGAEISRWRHRFN